MEGNTMKNTMKRIISLLLALLMMSCAMPCVAETIVTSDEARENAQWMQILLIGEDAQRDVHMGGRADSIMVCSINEQTGQIKLISIARDLWVEMDRFADRINAAYRYGGEELLLKAVNQTLQMDISNYITINFYGFCDVVDSIGGVEVELEPKEAYAINKKTNELYGNTEVVPIPVGATSAVLSGAQALGYARVRELDSDFKRTGRQRKVLMGILNKVLTLSFDEQKAFFDNCLACVTTNMETMQMFSLGMKILAHGMSDMEQVALPSPGHYYYVNHDGRSTYEFNKEIIVQEAHDFIYGTNVQEE